MDCPNCGEPEMLHYAGGDGEPDVLNCPECGHEELA